MASKSTGFTENTPLSAQEKQSETLRKLCFAGVFAALTYVVFTFLSIPIPTPGGGKVSVHLGNAFCVLGALFLGSAYGGVGGALGLTIADLIDPVYVVEAPATFVIKLLMGALAGFIAHRVFHISTETDHKKIIQGVTAAAAAAFIFNAVVDPVVRYFYKLLILGKPAAEVSFAINLGVTLINSVVSLILTIIVYEAMRVPLKKLGLFFEIS